MHDSTVSRWMPTWRLAACATGLLVLRQAWLLAVATRSAGRPVSFEARPRHRVARVLVVGDSTGLGMGAPFPAHSLPGLLAAEFSGLEVVNRCLSGARVGEVAAQVPAPTGRDAPFDLALVLAGGNDVLRPTGARQLRREAEELLLELKGAAKRVVWMGCANLGAAPAILPPLSWWLGFRTRRTMRSIAEVARRQGVEFIDFCDKRHADHFASAPGTYFAADGVHPSGAAYRYCFEALRERLRKLGVPIDAWHAGPPSPAVQGSAAATTRATRPARWADPRIAQGVAEDRRMARKMPYSAARPTSP